MLKVTNFPSVSLSSSEDLLGFDRRLSRVSVAQVIALSALTSVFCRFWTRKSVVLVSWLSLHKISGFTLATESLSQFSG